jgi:hypothetical protein
VCRPVHAHHAILRVSSHPSIWIALVHRIVVQIICIHPANRRVRVTHLTHAEGRKEGRKEGQKFGTIRGKNPIQSTQVPVMFHNLCYDLFFLRDAYV